MDACDDGQAHHAQEPALSRCEVDVSPRKVKGAPERKKGGLESPPFCADQPLPVSASAYQVSSLPQPPLGSVFVQVRSTGPFASLVMVNVLPESDVAVIV
jgi:hypothetical protein